VANECDVFVTGGTGYMGSRLITTLVGRGKAPNDSALSPSTRWYGRFGDEAVDDSVQQRRKTDPSYEPQNSGLPKLT
jgi:nucleoside-diphosphate-sugar epimerase